MTLLSHLANWHFRFNARNEGAKQFADGWDCVFQQRQRHIALEQRDLEPQGFIISKTI
jgi:hypothetical protein